MITPQEIEAKLQREDIQPYLNKVYDDFLPESLVEQFRIAMMYLPPAAHQFPMKLVEAMAFKSANEVTVADLGHMINTIYSVPFASMYGSLEEGIEKTKVFDKIRDEYNKSTAAFERKVAVKRQRLLNLSGVNNGTTHLHKS